MQTDTPQIKKKAPTLYAIIAIKLIKGLIFVILAIVIYAYSDNDLPTEYQHLLHHLKVNPERRFFSDLAIKIGSLTETRVIHAAIGTFLYSLFSLVEGVGLMFRAPWAGWLAIGESAFFIPLEINHLVHAGITSMVVVILGLNILIVCYLFRNRQRLFHHHHH
jgi:uncharacterized membrane protein (DUF2068 family)